MSSDMWSERAPRPTRIRVAGADLDVAPLPAALSPYRSALRFTDASPPPFTEEAPHPGPAHYQGRGLVGLEERRLRAAPIDAGLCVQIDDAVLLLVDREGRRLRAISSGGTSQVPAGLRDLTLLGPGLPLALALQGRYCLHASALAGPRGALALLGDSGAGKSTLARLLDGEQGFQRIADDALPIAVHGGRPVALPAFPQLKLPRDAQWSPPPGGEESLPLAGLIALDVRSGAAERVGVGLQPLGAREAAALVLHHTMAGRLLDAPRLGAQLAFAAAVAERVPAWRLRYPLRLDVGPAVAGALRAGGLAEAG